MTEFQEQISEGKNLNAVKCKNCTSIILTPSTANFNELEFNLPKIEQSKDSESVLTDLLTAFWVVDDIYAFHNVGFSTTVENTKYLVCADCEIGPIGYHDLTTKKSYVALSRVEHVN